MENAEAISKTKEELIAEIDTLPFTILSLWNDIEYPLDVAFISYLQDEAVVPDSTGVADLSASTPSSP